MHTGTEVHWVALDCAAGQSTEGESFIWDTSVLQWCSDGGKGRIKKERNKWKIEDDLLVTAVTISASRGRRHSGWCSINNSILPRYWGTWPTTWIDERNCPRTVYDTTAVMIADHYVERSRGGESFYVRAHGGHVRSYGQTLFFHHALSCSAYINPPETCQVYLGWILPVFFGVVQASLALASVPVPLRVPWRYGPAPIQK